MLRRKQGISCLTLVWQWFFGLTPKAESTKTKINKWDYIKLKQKKKLLHNKGNYHQMKRQLMGWERIFANHLSDKGLISKIYKELIQLNSKNTKKTQKTKQQKKSKRYEWVSLQRRHTHEKVLNIINHQGNAHQNQNEISPHTC